MQHSELAEWRLFSLLPSDEQSAFYTSPVFIWLCFFQRKFRWDWLQFNFILIIQLRRKKKRHKSQDFSIQDSTIDCMLISKRQKTCKLMCCHHFDMTGLWLNVLLKDTSEGQTGLKPYLHTWFILMRREWKLSKENVESSEQRSKDCWSDLSSLSKAAYLFLTMCFMINRVCKETKPKIPNHRNKVMKIKSK